MKVSSNRQPTPPTPTPPTPTPRTTQEADKLLVPIDYMWMLVEMGNIAPGRACNWSAESSGCTTGFSATWFVERKGLVAGRWDEVCFLSYQDGKIIAGFNTRFIDTYRAEYFAMIGLTKEYQSLVEWTDFQDPKGGK